VVFPQHLNLADLISYFKKYCRKNSCEAFHYPKINSGSWHTRRCFLFHFTCFRFFHGTIIIIIVIILICFGLLATGCPTGLPNVSSKTDDFRKVVFWHWRQSHLFLLIPSQFYFNKRAKVKNWQCCFKRGPRKARTFYALFLDPPEATLSISTSCSLFTRCLKSVDLRKNYSASRISK
jgi:hypothetical protein